MTGNQIYVSQLNVGEMLLTKFQSNRLVKSNLTASESLVKWVFNVLDHCEIIRRSSVICLNLNFTIDLPRWCLMLFITPAILQLTELSKSHSDHPTANTYFPNSHNTFYFCTHGVLDQASYLPAFESVKYLHWTYSVLLHWLPWHDWHVTWQW